MNLFNNITVVFILLACLGCSNKEVTEQKKQEKATIKRCWDSGGMPTTSVWDNRLISCIYPQGYYQDGEGA